MKKTTMKSKMDDAVLLAVTQLATDLAEMRGYVHAMPTRIVTHRAEKIVEGITEPMVRASLRRLAAARKVVEEGRGRKLAWRLRSAKDDEAEAKHEKAQALATAIEGALIDRGVSRDEVDAMCGFGTFRINATTLARLLGLEVK